MERFCKDIRPLRPSGFGLIVDKSKATDTINFECNDTRLKNDEENIYEPFDNLDKIFIVIVMSVWIIVGFFMFFT